MCGTYRGIAALIVSFAIPTLAEAGKFTRGLGHKMDATMRVPQPPKAYLGKKNVRVEVSQVPADLGTPERIQQSVEQNLAPDLAPNSPQPEAIFRIAVASYDPPKVRTYTATETRQIKTGEKPLYNKDGTPKTLFGKQMTEPIYEDRQVPIGYWEGVGLLSLKVDVRSPAGAVLDSFAPSATFARKIVVSVAGESQKSGILPTPENITTAMILQVTAEFKPRYCLTYRQEAFPLAVDDELMSGNALAVAGNWQTALKQWETASIKNKKNSGDRLYNMAAAHEALAYEAYNKSQNMEEVQPMFAKALELYTQALTIDPGEKYIRQSSDRVQRAKSGMDEAMKQYAAQKFEAERLLAEMEDRQHKEEEKRRQDDAVRLEAEAGAKDLTSNRPDTPEEASFRKLVRLRLASLPADVPAPDQAKLEANGQQIYKLDTKKAKRVVSQEVKKRQAHETGIATYKENLAAFINDKLLTKDERATLDEIAKANDLSPEDTHAVEVKYKFREEGKVVRRVSKAGTPTPQKAAAPSAVKK
ncbi:MAG: hypothetical protein ACR2NN_01810 [Bryobacteraceae bacterium]